MRTASSGFDLILEQRASNEAPQHEGPLVGDPPSAAEAPALGHVGRFIAIVVALGVICAATLFGVELTRPGPLLSSTTAPATPSAASPG
jgi:hypothetical protein